MLLRSWRQRLRSVVEALRPNAIRDGMRARLSSFRPALETLEDRTLPSASPVGDVFVILMENHNWTQPGSYTAVPQIQGNPSAPYINNTLTKIGAFANNYENAAPGVHPSEPNYIWLEAGSNIGNATDADPSQAAGNLYNSPNFTQQLYNAGISWKSYQEDIDINTTNGEVLPQGQWTVPLKSVGPGTTATGVQYNYAAKHDPSVFFTNGNNQSASSYAPLQQLYTDLNNNTVAQFNYITPNQYNDMHSTRTGPTDLIAQGDSWLAQNIPIIMASQAYKNNGVIMVVWDETEGGDTSQFTIPFFLISPLAQAGASNNVLYTHSSVLKTLEEIEGVGNLGGPGGASVAAANDLSALFKPGVLTPSPFINPDTADRSAAFQNLTPQERAVQAMYLDDLGRPGSVSELDGWVALLNGSASSQALVAMDIQQSAEGRDHLVKDWYVAYLGRAPQNGEEMGWVNALSAGQSEAQVLSGILSTPEFLQHAASALPAPGLSGTQPQQYVQALYQELLGRAPSAGEQTSWVNALNGVGQPALTMQQVAFDFLLATEFRTDLFQGYYTVLLHRPADTAGLNGWVSSGLDLGAVEADMEGSPEFASNG